jgi:hypothetical protein
VSAACIASILADPPPPGGRYSQPAGGPAIAINKLISNVVCRASILVCVWRLHMRRMKAGQTHKLEAVAELEADASCATLFKL